MSNLPAWLESFLRELPANSSLWDLFDIPNEGLWAFSIATAPSEAVVRALEQQGLRMHLLQQVHGSDYAELNLSEKGRAQNVPGILLRPAADAWLWLRSGLAGNQAQTAETKAVGQPTRQPQVCLAIYTADCVPALLRLRQPGHEPDCGALLHLGRKGIESGLLQNCIRALLERMHREGYSQPLSFSLAMGPSIGPCCYELPRLWHKNFAGMQTSARPACTSIPTRRRARATGCSTCGKRFRIRL